VAHVASALAELFKELRPLARGLDQASQDSDVNHGQQQSVASAHWTRGEWTGDEKPQQPLQPPEDFRFSSRSSSSTTSVAASSRSQSSPEDEAGASLRAALNGTALEAVAASPCLKPAQRASRASKVILRAVPASSSAPKPTGLSQPVSWGKAGIKVRAGSPTRVDARAVPAAGDGRATSGAGHGQQQGDGHHGDGQGEGHGVVTSASNSSPHAVAAQRRLAKGQPKTRRRSLSAPPVDPGRPSSFQWRRPASPRTPSLPPPTSSRPQSPLDSDIVFVDAAALTSVFPRQQLHSRPSCGR
jgi:hypothetical protein